MIYEKSQKTFLLRGIWATTNRGLMFNPPAYKDEISLIKTEVHAHKSEKIVFFLLVFWQNTDTSEKNSLWLPLCIMVRYGTP